MHPEIARSRLHCANCGDVIPPGSQIGTYSSSRYSKIIACTSCFAHRLNKSLRKFPDLAAIIAEQDAKKMRSFDPGI